MYTGSDASPGFARGAGEGKPVQPKFAGGVWAEDAASWMVREHGLSTDPDQPCSAAPLAVTAVQGRKGQGVPAGCCSGRSAGIDG